MTPEQEESDLADITTTITHRVRAECELLAAIMPDISASIVVAVGSGVSDKDFVNYDTLCIWRALRCASDFRLTAEQARLYTFDEAQRMLEEEFRWEESDMRPFVTGGLRWGPGPLRALIDGVKNVDFDLVKRKVLALRDVDRRQRAIMKAMEDKK